MLNKITLEFLSKKPNDEEMMAFLQEHIYARHLFSDDILSIIERLSDERNKNRAIKKYVVNDILSLNMERVFSIILNIKDQEISERAEFLIVQRLGKLKDDNKKDNNDYYNKKISYAIIGYISGLEQSGEYGEKIDSIHRAKELLQEVVEANMVEEVDLMTFLVNVDFSRWNRADLEMYERFLNSENYQELMEMWEEVQGNATKNLITGVIEEAKQQKIPLEELTQEFLRAVASEGINTADLYSWILKSEAFKLVAEQRTELSTGEKVFKELNVEK